MMRLDTPRGNRRPDNSHGPPLGRTSGNVRRVVGLVIVLVGLPPTLAAGQLPGHPKALPQPYQPAAGGLKSLPERPSIKQPPAAYDAAMVGFDSLNEQNLDRLDALLDSHAWDGIGAGQCPECGASYAEPACDAGYCEPACDGPCLRQRLRALLARPERHRGMGHPLHRESWLYRPFSAGWYVGAVTGSPLIGDWIGLETGFLGGYRFGWDQTYYWGGEMRFAMGAVKLHDSDQAIAAQQAADAALGLPAGHPYLQRFEQRRDANLFQWDLDVLYYPWGDSQWRPYLIMGLGAARIAFTDRLSVRRDDTLLAMPLGLGLKYRCNDWLVLRLECADNMAFGSGLRALHNLALNGGVEVRFGGARKAYWPWNPGRYYW